MRRLLTLIQMCDAIGVSKSRYYDMLKPTSKWFDAQAPLPKDYYGDTKGRFSSDDIEDYIDILIARLAAAA